MANVKKWYSFSNISTGALILFAILMFINPNVKATVIQGLMQLGIFNPTVKQSSSLLANNKDANYDVQFSNARNEIVNNAAIKGKVVFINFWATWCPPCIAEMPSINRLYNNYKSNKDIIFLLVDADSNLNKAEAYMKKKKFELPVYIADKPVPREWYEGSLPTTIVLDKKGNMVFRHEGAAFYGARSFKAFIDQLLAAK